MQEENYSIKEWAKDDRPREKLLLHGPEHLSVSELLAILIQSGTPRKSALELSQQVLRLGKNNLNELGTFSVKDLMQVKGIGQVRALIIVAALELGRRRHASRSLEKNAAFSSKETAEYLQILLKDYRHEVFAVLFLNRANRINHFEVISQGGITGTVADQRIIIKKALDQSATGIVLCHNHPSGSLSPSRADEVITRKVREAAALFDIRIIDHLIVSPDGYFSFCDAGLL